MKKNTIATIYAALSAINYDNAEVMDELQKELNRDSERKAANAAAYEALREIILGNLDEVPVTVSELYEAIEDKFPEGTTRGKVQYALTHYWQEAIEIIPGKPNTYRRK